MKFFFPYIWVLYFALLALKTKNKRYVSSRLEYWELHAWWDATCYGRSNGRRALEIIWQKKLNSTHFHVSWQLIYL